MEFDEMKTKAKLNIHNLGVKLLEGDVEEVYRGWVKEKVRVENQNKILESSNYGFNFYKYIVDQIARIYDGRIERTAGKGSPILKRYNSIEFNSIIQTANYYTTGLGYTVMFVGYQENDGLYYNLYTPNNFIYEFDDDNKLSKIEITIKMSDLHRKVDRWQIVDGRGVYQRAIITESNEKVEHEQELNYYINNKAVLPFVFLNNRQNVNGEVDIDSNDDLYYAAMMCYWYQGLMNIAITGEVIRKPYIAGQFNKSDLPNSIENYFNILKIQSVSDISVGYLTQGFDIDRIQKVITNEILKMMAGFGVSTDKFSINGSSVSGISIKLSNYGILEMRRKKIPIWRKHEKEIFKLSNVVAKANGSKHFDDDELKIDFGEISLPKSNDEILKEEAIGIQNNTTSPVHLLMSKKGMSEDEAIEEYKKIKSYNELKEDIFID